METWRDFFIRVMTWQIIRINHRSACASGAVIAAWLLMACAQPSPWPVPAEPAGTALPAESSPSVTWVPITTESLATWQHQTFPGKRASVYRDAAHEGRQAVLARAESSASMLRQAVHVAPSDLRHLQFSWNVPALIPQADMALRDADDSPVRVVLVFEGDRGKFSMKNAMLSELAQAMTGEPMPYATLMYVWCNTRAPGSVIINPRTDRIRKLVLESGEGRLNQWLDYRRDITADFEAAFGEAPGALLGVGIMTDSDNTRSKAQAWYGPMTLTKR